MVLKRYVALAEAEFPCVRGRAEIKLELFKPCFVFIITLYGQLYGFLQGDLLL